MTDKDKLIETLRRYAKGRSNDVERGLESKKLSALLVEKYAVGIVDTIRTLELDINTLATECRYALSFYRPKN